MILNRLLALGLCAILATPAFTQAPRKDLLGELLPEGAISRMGSDRLRASGEIICLSFTPDGKSLVSGGRSDKLTFWSVATGRIEKEWTTQASSVAGIHFDKSGKTVALSTNQSIVLILDGTTGDERRRLAEPRDCKGSYFASLSPDGKWLGMSHRENSRTLIFDVETGVMKHRFGRIDSSNRLDVVFTPDSKQFVSLWTDDTLHLVDLATGKSVRGLETGTRDDEVGAKGSDSGTRTMAAVLSSDGKRLIYRAFSDHHFYVVDVTNGKEVKRIDRRVGTNPWSRSLALTPNDRFIIDGSGDESIRVHGVASGKVLRELSVPNAFLESATVSPDGKLVAVAAHNTIYIWDIASGKHLHGGTGHTNIVTHVAFSPDGKYLVSTDSNSMRVWESATGKERCVTGSNIDGYDTTHLDIAPDNKSIRWVGRERAVYRWKFDTEREPTKRTTPGRPLTNSTTVEVTSPDGKLCAVIDCADRKLKLLDNIGNAPDRELDVLADVHSNVVSFSPDGRTLALASSDRSVTLYDVATGSGNRKLMPDLTNSTYPGNLVEFSPDSRMLLHYDGETRVVETMSGSDRVLLSREPSGEPSCMSCSVDGRLVARSFSDGLLVVTDIWTGREVLRRETGQGPVTSLTLSRDGKRLATGGSNTTAMVWELPPPRS